MVHVSSAIVPSTTTTITSTSDEPFHSPASFKYGFYCCNSFCIYSLLGRASSPASYQGVHQNNSLRNSSIICYSVLMTSYMYGLD